MKLLKALVWFSRHKGLPGWIRATALAVCLVLRPIVGAADNTTSQIGSQVVISYYKTSVSPGQWTVFGKIRSVSGFGTARPEVDSTTLDSTAVERIGGLPDGKQVQIVLATASANMDLIEGWVTAGTAIDLRIVFPSPLSETRWFTIIPLETDHGTIQPSGLLELTLTGRITGAIATTQSHP